MVKITNNIKTTAHFINIGGFTTQYLNSFQGFTAKHSTWDTILWTEKDIHKLVVKHNEQEYFYKLDTFINRYNFSKYLILAEYGGWYVDLDIIWKKSLDELIRDKMALSMERRFPEIFVPVRTFPRQKKVNLNMNDDNILYAEKGLLFDLINFAKNREDVDHSKKYEPFGPVSLSRWLYERHDLEKIYMFEDEIQENGTYCSHLNSTSWKIS